MRHTTKKLCEPWNKQQSTRACEALSKIQSATQPYWSFARSGCVVIFYSIYTFFHMNSPRSTFLSRLALNFKSSNRALIKVSTDMYIYSAVWPHFQKYFILFVICCCCCCFCHCLALSRAMLFDHFIDLCQIFGNFIIIFHLCDLFQLLFFLLFITFLNSPFFPLCLCKGFRLSIYFFIHQKPKYEMKNWSECDYDLY